MNNNALEIRELNGRRIYKSFYPWPCFVIDNFFNRNQLNLIQKNILAKKSNTEFRRLLDHPFKINYNVVSGAVIYDWFSSKEMEDLLTKLTNKKFYINPKSAIQYRTMDSASPAFDPHSDFMGEESLVMIIYLSDNWSVEKGGEFVQMSSLKVELDNQTVIHPICNRALIFETKQEYYHRVEKVNEGNRDSLIIEWLKK